MMDKLIYLEPLPEIYVETHNWNHQQITTTDHHKDVEMLNHIMLPLWCISLVYRPVNVLVMIQS